MRAAAAAAVVAAAALAAFAAGSPLLTAKPSPTWTTAQVWIDRVVEHQSPSGMFCDETWQPCVVNTTRCPWDADDEVRLFFQGPLQAGEASSTTWCLLADWAEHITWLESRTDGVTATVMIGPVAATGRVACVEGPDYDSGSPKVPEVPGSNGGRAVLTEVKFTVTNLTGRRASHVYAAGGVAPDFGQDHGCVWGSRFGFDPAWAVGSS